MPSRREAGSSNARQQVWMLPATARFPSSAVALACLLVFVVHDGMQACSVPCGNIPTLVAC
eukprot:scaffold253609_cov16-Tisochrysis_lutea.AAC.3